MNGHRVVRQEIGEDGQLHYYDEENNEVFAKVHPLRWRLLTIWIIIFTLFMGYGVTQNSQRIKDTQAERVASCKRTYEGVRQVFKPFFRPPKLRTAKEKRDIKKFNNIIDKNKAGCAEQVKGNRHEARQTRIQTRSQNTQTTSSTNRTRENP